MQTDFYAPETSENNTPEKPTRKRNPIVTIACAIAAVILVFILICMLFFTIRPARIDVQIGYDSSNPVLESKYTREDVLEAAGITGDMLSFMTDTAKIKTTINLDYRFDCTEVKIMNGNEMQIIVRQRQKRAYMDAGGVLFTIDEDGMILERCGTQRADDALILVEGMMPTNPMVGQMLVPNKNDQLIAYREVLEQLNDLGLLSVFSTLNVRDPNDIYLSSKSGYTIHLGDRNELRKKIKTVKIVLETLVLCREAAVTQEDINKYSSGILEVLEPGKVVYSPIY